MGRSPRAVLAAYRFAEHAAKVDAPTLRRWQVARMAELAQHARGRVPLYRELYGPRSVVTPANVLELPTVDRTAFRSVPFADRLSGTPPPGSLTRHTSGSTGEPLAVVYPPGRTRWSWVLGMRARRARGVPPWSRQLSIFLRTGDRQDRVSKVGRVLRRRSRVIHSSRSVADIAAEVAAFRPRVLSGPADLMLEVGEVLEPANRPREVVTGGQRLDDVLRAALTTLYGSEPMDDYGALEVGLIAWQCGARDLYHVDHETVLVEVLDEHACAVGPGGVGEVVLTGLVNPLMPVLRYRIGDVAAMADRPCACGHRLPALAAVDGRRLDWLVAPGGRRLAPQHLRIENHVPAGELATVLRRYRLHQSASGKVTLELELAGRAPDGLVERLERSYGRMLPVEVRVVDSIRPGPGGKLELISTEAT